MRKVYKSLVLATIPFIIAFLTYGTFPLLLGNGMPPLEESFMFTLYHASMDALAIFGASYVMFRMM